MEGVQFVSETEVAELLGVAKQTVRGWRASRRVLIPYYRLGRTIRYVVGDVIEYAEAHRVGKSSLPTAAADQAALRM